MRSNRFPGRLVRALAALAAAGCGGAATTAVEPAPSSSPRSPTPVAVAGDGYRLAVPLGWTDRTSDALAYARAVRADEGAGLLVLVHPVAGVPTARVNDVQGDIVVLRLNDPVPDDQLEAFAAHAGSTSTPAALSQVSLDGSTAYTISYRQEIQGTPGDSEEIFVNHAGATYDISLTTSAFAFPGQAQDFTALLHSWHWTG